MLRGKKSESERFPGAVDTYTLEALIRDGKALQAATSHHLGQGFARAFDVRYTGRDGDEHHPHATSWGATTSPVGGVVMAHGDDRGLRLPPRVAPQQVVIVPIFREDERARKDVQTTLFRTARDEQERRTLRDPRGYDEMCLPLAEQPTRSGACVCCGRSAVAAAVWPHAYEPGAV